MSFKMCPPWEWAMFLSWRDLITLDESPSKIELKKPIFAEKRTACRAAKISTSSAEWGFIIFSEKAAKTPPSKLRITTPIPTLSDSPNRALSKLIFTWFSYGGHQLATVATLLTSNPCWPNLSESFVDSFQQHRLLCPKVLWQIGVETCSGGAIQTMPWLQTVGTVDDFSALNEPGPKMNLPYPIC